VECQEVLQNLFQMVELRFQRLKLEVGTCRRMAARVAWLCNGPSLVEKVDDCIESNAGGADSANLRDCCMRSNAEERTRTYHLSG
jgi:hypothetical protein